VHPVTIPECDQDALVCPGCGATRDQHAAGRQFEAACQAVAAAWPLPPGDFLTGAPDEHGWHALARADAEWCALRFGRLFSFTVCGRMGRRADKHGAWNPAEPLRRCPDCEWAVAAAVGQLAETAARLAPGPEDEAVLAGLIPSPLIASETAALIIAAATRDGGQPGDETIQLLATVSRHAPQVLRSVDCHQGDCGHDDQGSCPAIVACEACSLQLGSWAGVEREGTYRGECTIPAPCQVLTAIRAAALADKPAA
jgi:hypothetical protein